MKTFFFYLKIPLRYLQPPNYSHVAGPDEKVKSVRKEHGSCPKPSPAQPCSGHPHVTCVLPQTLLHIFAGDMGSMEWPAPGVASHGCPQQDGILLSFLPSFYPSIFVFSLEHSGSGDRSCPCSWPILCPPQLCCCQTRLFAPQCCVYGPLSAPLQHHCYCHNADPCTPWSAKQPLQTHAAMPWTAQGSARLPPPMPCTARGAMHSLGCTRSPLPQAYCAIH